MEEREGERERGMGKVTFWNCMSEVLEVNYTAAVSTTQLLFPHAHSTASKQRMEGRLCMEVEVEVQPSITQPNI